MMTSTIYSINSQLDRKSSNPHQKVIKSKNDDNKEKKKKHDDNLMTV